MLVTANVYTHSLAPLHSYIIHGPWQRTTTKPEYESPGPVAGRKEAREAMIKHNKSKNKKVTVTRGKYNLVITFTRIAIN